MATDDETKKNSPNDWSFVAEEIQSDDGDSSGNYRADTMLCFLKHGTLALTFHANSNCGIVCSKCFQFMKPGSFALHCDKCNKQPAPSAKVVQEWADSDKKWANLKREFPQEFADKTRVKIAQRDGVSAYVIHPLLYLGKTASTITLKTICITDGCTHVCAFNALHWHFKSCHMNKSYSVFPADIIEAPTTNNIEDSSENEENASEEASDSASAKDNEEVAEHVEERNDEAGVEGTANKDDDDTEKTTNMTEKRKRIAIKITGMTKKEKTMRRERENLMKTSRKAERILLQARRTWTASLSRRTTAHRTMTRR